VTATSHSRRLRERIEEALPDLAGATSALFAHPRFRELYVEFGTTLHQMIRASVPLMREARDRAHALAPYDPVAAAMVPYLDDHIPEETHHDEWLLEDLEGIGVARATVLARMPGSAVASMIGAHYYWIRHVHPLAQLGQIAAMEGYPPAPTTVDALVSRTGLPREAFRTIDLHCRLDPHHRDALDAALDAMPLDDAHHEILAVSAVHTVRAAARAFDSILAGERMPAARPGLTVRPGDAGGDLLVEDAGRGARFRVGEQEGFLLGRCDGRRSLDDVRREFDERFGGTLSRADLDEFLALARRERWFAEEPAA
jgi:hypothetical protein